MRNRWLKRECCHQELQEMLMQADSQTEIPEDNNTQLKFVTVTLNPLQIFVPQQEVCVGNVFREVCLF